MMTLTLNGQLKTFDFEAPVSVETVLAQLSVNGRHVVVEKGGSTERSGEGQNCAE